MVGKYVATETAPEWCPLLLVDALAAAREAVVKAAMAWFRSAPGRVALDATVNLSNACAALAKLEGK
jgi:hypothetical protein